MNECMNASQKFQDLCDYMKTYENRFANHQELLELLESAQWRKHKIEMRLSEDLLSRKKSNTGFAY